MGGVGSIITGLTDMGIGGVTEGLNAMTRALAAGGLGIRTDQITSNRRNEISAGRSEFDRINRTESERMGSLYDQTVGDKNNPYFQMGAGGPKLDLNNPNPKVMGQATAIAVQNYGVLKEQGAADLKATRELMERTRTDIQKSGDAALDDITDTVGAGLSGYAASAKSSIDARDAELEAQVAAGTIPAATAQALRDQYRGAAVASMRDNARQLVGDRGKALAEARLTTSAQLASAMTSLGATTANQAANYLATLNSAGQGVVGAFEADRNAARASAAFTESIIRSDANTKRQTVLFHQSQLSEATALEYAGARDVASIVAGIALNPQNIAGASNTWANFKNEQAAEDANDTSWF